MAMTMTVEIRSMRIHAFHGLMPQERKVGNMFEVSASLSYRVPDDATGCDDIHTTVCYATMAGIIKTEMAKPRDLLETVAISIRRALTGQWPHTVAGSVTIVKLTPPIAAQMQGAAVTLSW